MHGEEGFPDGKGRPRNGNPRFYDLLDDLARTHDKKSHDYASNDNPSGNYHFAGQMASMFSHSPQDAGFFGRIAEKIYRLANLESGGKTARNESVEDTERDIAVITILWMVDRRERRTKPNPLETELFDLIKLMPDHQTAKIVEFIMEMKKIRSHHAVGVHEVPGPGMSEQGRDVMNIEAGKAPNLYTNMGAYAKGVAADVPNQGQPAAMTHEVEEVLRMILMTNNRILHMLGR